MSKQRTPIGSFIHSSWTSINIRCGKYQHIQTEYQKLKNKTYKNIIIEFTQPEYKEWCLNNKKQILSLKKPSIDRIDTTKNYSLDNIQVIELKENVGKKRFGCRYINGPLENTPRGVSKSGNKWRARISFKSKETHLGTFNSKEEALEVFKKEYYKLYGKNPF